MPSAQPSPPGVLSPEGAAAARAWIAATLGTVEEALSIEVIRQLSWGDIWRIEAGGRFRFKAPHPRLAREVALRRRLETIAPDGILPLVAGDAGRGWQLTADAGPTLAALTRDAHDEPRGDVGPGLHADLARALGAVQRRVRADDLAGLGLAVFDPARAVETFEREVAPFAALPAEHPAHCSAADQARAAAALADLVGRWERAGGTDLPLGLDHNDAHAGNAYQRDGRVLVSDWGDAVIGHPFASLRALLVPLRITFGTEAVALVRGAYLEGFVGDDGGGVSSVDLEALLDLAMMLAVPNRLHCWAALEDAAAWAAYADWIVPLWREAGTPVEEVTAP